MGIIPIIPFGLISGILGAKYGFWGGGMISVAASSLAALITEFFERENPLL